MHRFARKSHDRGDEHCSSAVTAQTFFLTRDDLVRPRGRWSGTWWRRRRNPTTTTAQPAHCYFDPANIYYPCTYNKSQGRSTSTTRTIYLNTYIFYIASITLTIVLGQIFHRNRHLCLLLSYNTIIYAVRYDTIYNKYLIVLQSRLSHTYYLFITMRRVSGQVQQIFFASH